MLRAAASAALRKSSIKTEQSHTNRSLRGASPWLCLVLGAIGVAAPRVSGTANQMNCATRRRARQTLARIVAQWLSENIGQQVIVENKPGAGNNIGTEAVVNSPRTVHHAFLVNPQTGSTPRSTKTLLQFHRDIFGRRASSPQCDGCYQQIASKKSPSSSPTAKPIQQSEYGLIEQRRPHTSPANSLNR